MGTVRIEGNIAAPHRCPSLGTSKKPSLRSCAWTGACCGAEVWDPSGLHDLKKRGRGKLTVPRGGCMVSWG
mgnify:CR=1 FL=1